MSGKYMIKKTDTGTKFDLKASNGEVILSSQVYASESSCMAGIASVRSNVASGSMSIEDQTVEGFTQEKHPKFEIYLDKAGEYRFRMKARNGEIIGTSEGYKTKAGCKNGVESVVKNAPDAKVEE